MKMRVLITGGAGFIGSHVATAYAEHGYEVVIVDNLSSGSLGNISDIKADFINADICDYQSLDKIFADFKPDIVNHHAAQKSVAYSVENPVYDARENIFGLLNVLNSVGKHKVKNVMFVSSGGALSALKETDTPQLHSPYALTKFAGENYVRIYAQIHGYDYSILRYANVYGPRQIADGECGVIPIFIGNILAGKPSVLTTYPDMPRGCIRDYVYVGDVVKANLALSEKPVGCPVNIASSKEYATLDVYETIVKVFASTQPIITAPPRPGDIRRSVLDVGLINRLVGWSPEVDLTTGLTILKKLCL
jgi:UDP-glucose 4-epimerase